MKKQKGITLIALVITIIVLLILAGVTIYMLTGPNGVITNSQRAKLDTMEKGAIERIDIALNAIKTEILAQLAEDPTYDASSKADQLKSENVTGIKENGNDTGYKVEVKPDDPKTITITFETNDYQKLKKSVGESSTGNEKVEGSIDLTTTTITPAAVKENGGT